MVEQIRANVFYSTFLNVFYSGYILNVLQFFSWIFLRLWESVEVSDAMQILSQVTECRAVETAAANGESICVSSFT